MISNAGLEQRVADRTRDLENALREQKLLQDRLIETGKLTAPGQLSSGIAHELNTPLGAIQSSSHSLARFFDEILAGYSIFYASLSPSERKLHDAFLETGLQEAHKPGSLPPGRKEVRGIASSLERAGIVDVEEMADQIADMGISESFASIIPLLGTGKDRDIVRIAAEIIVARRLVGVMEEASTMGASVITALQSYISPHENGRIGLIDIQADISRRGMV